MEFRSNADKFQSHIWILHHLYNVPLDLSHEEFCKYCQDVERRSRQYADRKNSKKKMLSTVDAATESELLLSTPNDVLSSVALTKLIHAPRVMNAALSQDVREQAVHSAFEVMRDEICGRVSPTVLMLQAFLMDRGGVPQLTLIRGERSVDVSSLELFMITRWLIMVFPEFFEQELSQAWPIIVERKCDRATKEDKEEISQEQVARACDDVLALIIHECTTRGILKIRNPPLVEGKSVEHLGDLLCFISSSWAPMSSSMLNNTDFLHVISWWRKKKSIHVDSTPMIASICIDVMTRLLDPSRPGLRIVFANEPRNWVEVGTLGLEHCFWAESAITLHALMAMNEKAWGTIPVRGRPYTAQDSWISMGIIMCRESLRNLDQKKENTHQSQINEKKSEEEEYGEEEWEDVHSSEEREVDPTNIERSFACEESETEDVTVNLQRKMLERALQAPKQPLLMCEYKRTPWICTGLFAAAFVMLLVERRLQYF